MPVVGLGHTGLWVDDLEKMRDFYTFGTRFLLVCQPGGTWL